VQFFAEHQSLLWAATLCIDLSITLCLYRLFGTRGLYGAVVLGIVMANIQGPKLTMVLGMQTSLGVILYSGIYFATDLLSEKYGKEEANRAVRLGFAVSIAVVVMMSIGLMFKPSTDPKTAAFALEVHTAFETILNFTPRFVFGSLLAYIISQSCDVWVFHYLKKRTNGRHLWLRNNVSTMVAQAIDTTIYSLVVWWGLVDLVTAIKLGLAKYFFKLVIAAFDTPFIYWARNWRVRRE
jgi:uncharacterized integral membrane protein (TIGR00697 family)